MAILLFIKDSENPHASAEEYCKAMQKQKKSMQGREDIKLKTNKFNMIIEKIIESKKRFPLAEAKAIAEDLLKELQIYCERIEIAGSIRRNRIDPADIDLVIIPKKYETGLFSTGIATVLDRFEKVKGDLVYGESRNAIRLHPKGIRLDIYFCEPENFGLINAIRTGSENFNRTVLIPAINRSGYKCKDGQLTYEDETIDVKEEESLFKLIGLSYVEPQKRGL